MLENKNGIYYNIVTYGRLCKENKKILWITMTKQYNFSEMEIFLGIN
jgi:hypothetical protein